MNAAIELHDSKVLRVRRVGADLILEVEAYVHMSEGTPGVDSGTGWSQPVEMTIRNAVVRSTIEDALWILDGEARVGAAKYDNMLPIDLDASGDVAIELSGAEGTLSISGTALRVSPIGEAVYVERFE